MKRAIVVALGTGALITSAAALSLTDTPEVSGSMARAEYDRARVELQDGMTRVMAACGAFLAPVDEWCRTEAQAAGMVREAEIEQAYRRTPQSARALQRARIDAKYQLDRARCGALGGYRRDKCFVQAHAAKGRALLEAAAPYEARF